MKPFENFLEDAVLVEVGVVRLDGDPLGNPPGERVKVDVAVGPGEVVAAHDLFVFDQNKFRFVLISTTRLLQNKNYFK